MSGLLEIIEEAIRSFFIGLIESNLITMFADVNEKTATIAEQIGQTPQGWNGNIFSMIRSLSETVSACRLRNVLPVGARQCEASPCGTPCN